jgi:hypothetical protein
VVETREGNLIRLGGKRIKKNEENKGIDVILSF